MSYGLGIDLGTRCTVAAIARTGVQGIGIETVPLTARTLGVASVLYLGAYGSVLVGAAAEQHVLTEPERVFRGFVRRVGQASSPQGQPAAEELTARLVRWVVDTVTAGEGTQPDQIALTHPPDWGQRERELVTGALRESRINEPLFVPTPVAAAAGWAAAREYEPSGPLAVHDLGAMVDATVLAPTGTGEFTLLGTPRTLAHAGGTALDEIVFAHIVNVLGDRIGDLDRDDSVVRAGMALLLEDCVLAREALSDNTEALVPVVLPGVDAWIELTRSQLEEMIRPALQDGARALRDAISAAQLTVPELETVLVTGGVARTPLVASLLAEELGRPVTVSTDPLHNAASGAALATSTLRETRASSAVAPDPSAMTVPVQRAEPPELTSVGSPEIAGRAAGLRSRQRALLTAAAGVFALAAAVVPITIVQSTGSSGVPPVSPTEDATGGLADRGVPGSTRYGIVTDGSTGAADHPAVDPREQQLIAPATSRPGTARTSGTTTRFAPVAPPVPGLPPSPPAGTPAPTIPSPSPSNTAPPTSPTSTTTSPTPSTTTSPAPTTSAPPSTTPTATRTTSTPTRGTPGPTLSPPSRTTSPAPGPSLPSPRR
ncbi:MAG: Hsp70 family protein [Actinomycetota bacterium]|nr:Hsp70 family protein [Actinomycetota bacterium]